MFLYCILFRVLEETREMLEEQLARARKRADHMVQLEADVLKYKQTINDLALVICYTPVILVI